MTGRDSIEAVVGNEGGTRIEGTDGYNHLDFSNTKLNNVSEIDAGAGNDYVKGSQADDIIIGGEGNDRLYGNDGNDTFIYNEGDGADPFSGGEGTDVVDATNAKTLDLTHMTGRKSVEAGTQVDLGGRRIRTYLTEGLWQKSLDRLREGDFVMMQFGHNDGGKMFEGDRPRASIKGNSDESIDGVVEATGKAETVHSFGWYLRKYIADAKAKGAIPIVLSQIPRDRWQGGRVIRSDKDYGLWAREAAKQSGALFIDLNEIVARRYEELGEEKVGRDLFTPEDWTHTKREGAEINAACVAEGVKSLKDCDLKECLRKETDTNLPPTGN